jgi:exosome complex RNA-binding protein Csl4
MSIQIKSDRRETENKTVRFPVDLIARIEEIMREKDVSFSGFVIQACEYVVNELEAEKSDNKT